MANQVSVFQTIQTKYISPSNFKGTRIKAKTASGKAIVLGWDYALNADENHAVAAQQLQNKMGWTGSNYGELIGGQQANGDYVWILGGTVKELGEIDPPPSNEPVKLMCQNCSEEYGVDEVELIDDIFERVSPGEIMPWGQCPECGAVCFPVNGR